MIRHFPRPGSDLPPLPGHFYCAQLKNLLRRTQTDCFVSAGRAVPPDETIPACAQDSVSESFETAGNTSGLAERGGAAVS
jgi:hypothetical protein